MAGRNFIFDNATVLLSLLDCEAVTISSLMHWIQMEKRGRKPMIFASLRREGLYLAFGLLTALCGVGMGGPEEPKIPNLEWSRSEVFRSIGRITSRKGAPLAHGLLAMHQGYLVVVFSIDGGKGKGGFAFYDITNPRRPRLVSRVHDPARYPGIREAHAFGFSNSYPGESVVLQSRDGVQFWDWSEVRRPLLLSRLHLPPMTGGNYNNTAWWLFWQAPFVYVGGSNTGIHIVDARNLRHPKQVGPPLPIGRTGGFRVGPIFAVGNLLVVTSMDKNTGIATLDISDPRRPELLAARTDVPPAYSAMLNGHYLYLAGVDGRAYVYDLSDPEKIRSAGRSEVVGGKGGYLFYQEGFIHAGMSHNYAKLDARDPRHLKLAGKARPGAIIPDFDFVTPFGNLVALSDDHWNGTFLIPHQREPDRSGPKINWIVPADGSHGQALTTRIGVTLTEPVDLGSVNEKTFIVRPRGGQPLQGKYSEQTGILNFSPNKQLLPDMTYEVEFIAGGIRDLVGNPAPETFRSYFSTGSSVGRLSCRLKTGGPAPNGIAVRLEVEQISRAGDYQFAWDFGDGGKSTGPGRSVTHIYNEPGHYRVTVRISRGKDRAVSSLVQTVYRAPAARPSRGTSTIVYDVRRRRVWAANRDNGTVTAINAASLKRLFEVSAGKQPRTIALGPRDNLWVAGQDPAEIRVLGGARGKLIRRILLPPGSRPFGILFGPAKRSGYVSLEGSGEVAQLDLAAMKIERRMKVCARPRGMAISPDGRRLFVCRFLSSQERGEVIEVNLKEFRVTSVTALAPDRGPDREDAGRGVPNYLGMPVISPDGTRLWLPSQKHNVFRGLKRDGLPLTFESTVRTIVSQIDLRTGKELLDARRDLNDRSMASAVAFSALGDYVFVALMGSNAIDILDAYDGRLMESVMDVGLAPQGLVVSPDGRRLFAHSFLSRSVLVFDLTSLVERGAFTVKRLAEIATVVRERMPSKVLRGKRIFYNAQDLRMNRDGYLSCASCHLEGGQDGRVYDFTDRGEGYRNTISLRGRGTGAHGRFHWSANFDEVQDFEHDIRNAFRGQGFLSDAAFHAERRDRSLGGRKEGASLELDALAAYVHSLKEVHRSPFRQSNGQLTPEGRRGREIFRRLSCSVCHWGPAYTDSCFFLLHDVGTLKATSGKRLKGPLPGIDTPTLRGVWETGPYLHDGSAPTLMDVFDSAGMKGPHGQVTRLSEAERRALVEYLMQIDDDEGPAGVGRPRLVVDIESRRSPPRAGDSVTLRARTGPALRSVEVWAGSIKRAESTTTPFQFKWIAGKDFPLNETVQVVARFVSGGSTTFVGPRPVRSGKILLAEFPGEIAPGLIAHYYEGKWRRIPKFDTRSCVWAGVLGNFTLRPALRSTNFAFHYSGFLFVPADGAYTFFLRSNDGSILRVGDQKIVSNDGIHGMKEKWGRIGLQAGLHRLELDYFQRTFGRGLEVKYSGPGLKKQLLPDHVLFHSALGPKTQ